VKLFQKQKKGKVVVDPKIVVRKEFLTKKKQHNDIKPEDRWVKESLT